MSQLAVSNNQNFLITPNSLSEAMDYAKMIANSSFCPKQMISKPGDVLIAMQMGAEVGLSPMQALQNIAIINGRPSLWGDAALALVQGSQHYVSHREWTEGSIDKGDMTAYCAITRRGSDEYVKSFSQKDAERAGLWKKVGPWTQYPERMLQMRARAFAIRDKFADSLKGISVVEEVRDYQVIDVKHNQSKVVQISAPKQEAVVIENAFDCEAYINEVIADIEACETQKDLRDTFLQATKNQNIKGNTDAISKIIAAKDAKKSELTMKEFNEEYDADTGEVKE